MPRLEKLQNDKNERMKEEAIGESCRRMVMLENRFVAVNQVLVAWKEMLHLPAS